VASTATTSIFS